MGRLRLLGEQEGGGTADHSALSNLGYFQSGHTGFVPSQGEALIDILRLNQNLIRDSEGNDRLQLATSSPHVRARGDFCVDGLMALGRNPDPYTGLYVNTSLTNAVGGNVAAFKPGILSQTGGTSKFWRGLFGEATLQVASGASASVRILQFMMAVIGAGDILNTRGVDVATQLFMYSGAAFPIYGIYLTEPFLFSATAPTDDYGFYMPDHGASLGAVATNIFGIRIEDQTTVSGNIRLLELGPSTPYLRLVGGSNPPANKSNLYLKFGSTLYQVVKSGNYMTLEAA